MDAPRWWAIVLIAIALLPHVALGVERWVHRQDTTANDHAGRIDRLEAQWKRMADKQSELSGLWQQKIGETSEQIHTTRRQLERIEAHLEYIDRRLEIR